MILTHHPECLNVDHSIVHRATLTVFRPQRGETQDILGFYVPSSTDYNPNLSLRSNTYIDVAGYEDTKIKALRVYEEEMRKWNENRNKNFPIKRPIDEIDEMQQSLDKENPLYSFESICV